MIDKNASNEWVDVTITLQQQRHLSAVTVTNEILTLGPGSRSKPNMNLMTPGTKGW
jgi:hypothetical protein